MFNLCAIWHNLGIGATLHNLHLNLMWHNLHLNVMWLHIGHWIICHNVIIFHGPKDSYFMSDVVATLALGSRPKQRGCKGVGQREARESHQGLPGV
jgi:hypothetical protein